MAAEPRGVVGDGSPTGARRCHCGRVVEPRDPDPWEGRMDDYCYDCATNRCDCYPDECPVESRVASSSGTGGVGDGSPTVISGSSNGGGICPVYGRFGHLWGVVWRSYQRSILRCKCGAVGRG